MKKWFRWQGLIIFAGIMALVILFWVVFLDLILEKTIETYATEANGARVDIGNLDVSLFPAGMKIEDIQITDPDSPMKNALQVGGARFLVNTRLLLRSKVIIDQMSIEQIQLNTPRKKSGALKKREKKSRSAETSNRRDGSPAHGTAKKETFNVPALNTPDIKSILAKESIQSLALAKSLQSDLETEKGNWEKILKDLPDKKKIKAYKARIKKIKKKYKKKKKKKSLTALLYATGEYSDLKKDIEDDLERIEAAAKKYKKQKKEFKKRVKQLAEAPGKDIRRIKAKYSITPKGLSNISSLFIGPRVDQWFQKAIAWYQRVEPYLKNTRKQEKGPETKKPLRGKGSLVKFRENPPMPDFLIRRASISMGIESGSITGILENITTAPEILGKPTTFQLAGDKLKGIKSVHVNGEIDFIDPAQPKHRIDVAVRKYSLENVSLSDDRDFRVALQQASGDIDLNLNLNRERFSARLGSRFGSARFKTDTSKKPGRVISALATTLKNIRKFSFQVTAGGTLDKYSIRIKSDLDRILKSAVKNLIRQETARLEKKLSASIQKRVDGPVGQVMQGYKGYEWIGTELTRRLDLENKLLEELDL